MTVRQIVEQIIITHPRSSIGVNNSMGKAAEKEVEKKREAWIEAREKALLQRLTRSYGLAIFGSARLDRKNQEFRFVSHLAKSIVRTRQIDIITGGGPGIMQAAHEGAKEAIGQAKKEGKTFKAHTFGINIELPFEQRPNQHIDIYSTHSEFSTRLQEFIDKTQGVYIAPGGFGTLLELAMVLQLKQVGHLNKNYPIIVHPFWRPIFENMYQHMFINREGTSKVPFINPQDLKLVKITDDIKIIMRIFADDYDHWHEEYKSRERKISHFPFLFAGLPTYLKLHN